MAVAAAGSGCNLIAGPALGDYTLAPPPQTPACGEAGAGGTALTEDVARFVTNAESEQEDTFTICSDAAGSWFCETITLPEWAGYFEGGGSRGQLFQPIDADLDGETGFIAYAEHVVHCEPDVTVAEGWRCHWIAHEHNNFRRIGEIEIMDYDGDGAVDVLYSHRERGPEVCFGGNFPMSCHSIGITSTAELRAADWADFNQDGNLDVYLSYNKPWNTGYSQLCFGDGLGGFSCQNFIASSTSGSSANTDAKAFDANSDGLPDLYVEFNPSFGTTGELCLNQLDSPGSFICTYVDLPAVNYNGNHWGYGTTDLVAADLDGDGDEDLAMGSRGEAFVCWSDGAGVLDCSYLDGVSISSELTTEGATEQVAVADMNRDGLPDILKSGTHAITPVELCTNNGNQTFSCVPVGDIGPSFGVAVLAARECL